MLKLFCGDDIGVLARVLSERMRLLPPVDPLDKPVVVVQSMGMARWLSLFLAEQRGICVNIDFVFPGKFLYRFLFEPMSRLESDIVLPELGEGMLPFTPELNAWAIYGLLSEPGMVTDETVCRYVQSPLKRWQLSQRLSRLFDRYMTDRAPLLREWEKGKWKKDEEWQALLWGKLLSRTPGEVRHFSGLYDRLRERAQSDSLGLVLGDMRQLGAVSFFGFSAMPEAHIQMILDASKWVDIDFYWYNVSSADWGEGMSSKRRALQLPESVPCGHPLLGSLGGRGRQFFNLLMDLNGYDSGEAVAFREDFPDTMLGLFQRDIQQDEPGEKIVWQREGSIEIHSCFSPLREMEALYDVLLRTFAENPLLLPKDVIVYLPDVEYYAPYVEAVFGSEPEISRRIPYTIADRSVCAVGSVYGFFMNLLSLRSSRLEVSAVAGLLASEAVRERFGMKDDDLPVLEAWLRASHAAWGRDSEDRERLCGTGFEENSWRFVLKRLLYALMVEPGGAGALMDVDGTDVLVLSETAENPELAGAFSSFCRKLFAFQDALLHPHTGEGWTEVLVSGAETFLAETAENGWEIQLLRETLNGLSRLWRESGLWEKEIAFEAVESYLKTYAAVSVSDDGFCRGRVTFCRFQPMRSIPVKVAVMAGMNDGSFPRTDPSLSFDLMLRSPGKYDASMREDDRFAFLEALLSAREKLFIFYTGQSDADGEALPPSVLVSELTDALSERFEFSGGVETLTVKHPLHPFSRGYFDGSNPRLVNYGRSWFELAGNLLNRQERVCVVPERVAEPPPEVSLQELIRFYRDPCEFFMRSVSGAAAFSLEKSLPDDFEPETVQSLTAGRCRQEIFEYLLQGLDRTVIERLIRASGVLPPGSCGGLFFNTLYESARGLFSASCAAEWKSRRLEVETASGKVSGVLSGLSAGYLNRVVFYGVKPKYKLGCGMVHAFLSAARMRDLDLPAESRFYTPGEGAGVETFTFAPEGDGLWLSKLHEGYIEGLSKPLLFSPLCAETLLTAKTKAEGLTKAEALWANSLMARYYGSSLTSALGEELYEQAVRFYSPVLALCSKVRRGRAK